MKASAFLSALAMAAVGAAADVKLEDTLAALQRYRYEEGHQPVIELEKQVHRLPAAEVEKRLIEFLRGEATAAGKDYVCRQLSLIGTDASAPVLEGMLASAETAEMARYALERIPGEAASAALRNALAKAPAKARPGIVNSLGIRRDAQAVAAVSKLATAPDPALAGAAIAALGRIATPGALATLASLRKQGSAAAMEASLDAADYLATGRNRASALAIYRELGAAGAPVAIRIGALRGISAASGAEAVPQLLAAVRSTDARVQAAAIGLLNAIPGGQVTAALVDEMPKLAPAARARVVTALGTRGDRSALPTIVKAAKDSDEEVRLAAFSALAAVGDAGSAGMLAETAASETAAEAERAAARAALDRMPGRAVDQAIVAAISTAPGRVKAELMRSAGERAIAESSPALLAAARDSDPTVRREAYRALRETARGADVPALLELLTASGNEADRRESGRALSAALRRSPATPPAAILAAYRSSNDAAVKAALLQVMGQAGAKEALPELRAALKETNAELVRAVILALSEWPGEEPLNDLLAFAHETQDGGRQVLALRGVLKLMELPSPRSHAESAKVLAAVMALARQPEEKRGVLALLPRFPVKESLRLAEAAESDAAVAQEAKAALQRLRRMVRE
jgi:HEAT repeat protein